MTRRAGISALVLMPFLSSLALADAPFVSLIPLPRPQQAVVASKTGGAGLRPRPRPTMMAAPMREPFAQKPASAKGSVCGNPNIKGAAMQAIQSRIKGCNVAGPVSVTAINGVKLVPSATINCTQAQALADWIDRGLQPQFGNQVARLIIADSYSCRPRNNVPGGKVSEHGSGSAVDIEGIVLADGKVLTVAANFGGALRAAYKAACAEFSTTLGPGSDGYHETHIHLDVAKRGGRPYCR